MNMLIQMVQKSLQTLLSFLKNHKKKWLLFIGLSIGFVLIRFPYESAMLFLINQIQEKTKLAFQIKYDSFYINPLNPALVFNKPEILIKNRQVLLKAQQLQLKPSYSGLLQGKVGGSATLKWGDSILHFTLRKKTIQKDKTGWLIHIKTQDFNPALLSAFVPQLSHTKGKINLNVELLLDPLFKTQPEGTWQLTGQDFQSQALSHTFPDHIGTISLPDFRWSRLKSEGKISQGDISIMDISFGEKADSLQIQTRGVVSVEFAKQKYSKRMTSRFRNYNLGIKILVKEDLEPKLKKSLDLVLKATKSKTQGGYLYMAHIKGRQNNWLDVLPVDKLPSLSEIKQPPQEDLLDL